jgi:hypothetical protein
LVAGEGGIEMLNCWCDSKLINAWGDDDGILQVMQILHRHRNLGTISGKPYQHRTNAKSENF